jgi:SAM-dependent methyltransferase
MKRKRNFPKKEHWAYTLFVKYPELYLPVIESMREQSIKEVDGLCKIFKKFMVLPGSKILDLSCGIGRHSINLSKRGYEVIGYDPSDFFLDKARKWADKEGLNEEKIRFYGGDLSKIHKVLSDSGESRFNVIINMWNSHGYSSTDEDIQVFKDILRLASRNCIMVIESENRDWRIRNFEPCVIYDFNNSAIYETWKFNLETSISKSHSKFYQKTELGKDLHLILDLEINYRLYSIHELKDIITKAGWKYINTYGNIQKLDPATYDSKNIVTVGKKL